MGAKRLFHGHHHVNYQQKIDDGQHIIVIDGVGQGQCKNLLGEVLLFED